MSALVSILTPSLDQARFLPDCLGSVSMQTYPFVEHIVFDGGSTDETIAILRTSPPHVRWESEPDRGQSHALNKAYAASRGEFIGWINSDDGYADRRAVEWAVDVFRSHPSVDVVFGHALLVNETNEVLIVLPGAPFSSRLMRRAHYLVQPAVFMRRSAIEREPQFLREDLHYVMDRDLWFRLAKHSNFRLLDRILAIDRYQPDRKVQSGAYPLELARYDQSIGIEPSRVLEIVGAAVKVPIRWSGLPATLRMESQLDPALRLVLPRTGERARRQLLVRRKRLQGH